MREDVPFTTRCKLAAYINTHSPRDIEEAINAKVRAMGLAGFDDDGVADIAGRLVDLQRQRQNAHLANRAPAVAPVQFKQAAE